MKLLTSLRFHFSLPWLCNGTSWFALCRNCAPPACPALLPCLAPALTLTSVDSKKGWKAGYSSCVSKLTRTVNRVKGEVMCECLSFRALVPKK